MVIVAVLFLVSAADARRRLHSINDQHRISPTASSQDGICRLMAAPEGYACKEHLVMTKDGYILSMQRMPMGWSGKKVNQPPVLLQHGLLMDTATWLLNSPDESLAFILADRGFDVWFANTRGTNFSGGYISLSPSDPAYWEWSWDELAAYDLPASIKYVHDQTGQNLHYIGHSLGTLIAFSAFSQDQTLNMSRSAAFLSPIAYLGQMPSPLSRAAADAFIAERAAVAKLLEDLCRDPNNNCGDLMTSFTGKNCCVNSSMTDIFLEHEPQSTATKNMVHLVQMIRGGTIAKFDYVCDDENDKHYRQPTPPEYNMASIPNNFPLYLSYGGADALSDAKDVQTLLDGLKDHDADKLVLQYKEDYAHADFVFGVNAKQVVYDPLMAFFKLH